MSTERKTSEERKAILARDISNSISLGGRVESQSDYQAVIAYGKRLNHTFHGMMSFFTCGFWLLVWAILGKTGGEKREMVAVDEFGNVSATKL